MKKKVLLIVCIFVSLQMSYVDLADSRTYPIGIAFIRGGDLWFELLDGEIQVTHNQKASNPKWSYDGKFIAYFRGENPHEIWIYSLEQKQSRLVYAGGDNFQWAPNTNQLAFKIDEVLNIVNVNRDNVGEFKNVALGVGNYSRFPEGDAFLVSSTSHLLPIGWTSVQLFRVPVDSTKDRNKIKLFFTLPPESENFFAVGTSVFKWSSDKKWISFIAYPTASLSADSNTLCVLSSDAKILHQVDHILNDQDWFQWSPRNALLAYIGGEGRTIIQNKHLSVKELPTFKPSSYTPEGFVDRNFTWEDDTTIIVERSKESWTTAPKNAAQPSLYRLNIRTINQKQVSFPPKDFGDFNPYFLQRHKKLTWIRTDQKHTDVWISNPDGTDAKEFIKNMDWGTAYYERSNWGSVIDWYEPHD